MYMVLHTIHMVFHTEYILKLYSCVVSWTPTGGGAPLLVEQQGCATYFSAKRGGALWDALAFVVALLFFFEFWGVCADFSLHFGASGLDLGSILEVSGSILTPCWCNVGAMLGLFGARARTQWAGGVTRSVRNLGN